MIVFKGETEKEKELNKDLYECSLVIAQKDDEIKRLNNIINELEKTFEKTWQDYKDCESENLYAIAIENKNYLIMLQELKGSDKE